MFLNGNLYKVEDESSIDSFLENTFTFEETKQTKQYSDIEQLINKLKENIHIK